MSSHGHAPLVAFTALAIAGAGIVATTPVLWAGVPASVSTMAIAAGVALQALALAVSLFHLGRKSRAPMAARRAGRSALSNEIVMAGAALLASAALLAAIWREPSPAWLRALAGALGAGFLAALGLVYRIPGQLTWMGPAALTPITAGLAFGAAIIQSLASPPDGVPRAVIALVGIDAAVFLLRWQEVVAIDGAAAGISAGPLWRRRHQWLFVRFILLDVVPLALLLLWPTRFVIAAAAAGLLVDRVAFYGIAVQHTTEREIERVDEVIRSAAG